MRGDTRTEPPPLSVLKHSEATNGAEHAGAFRSVALPCGVATVTSRRSRRAQLSEDGDQHANEMEAMVESAPVEVDDPLVAYSTHNDALVVPSVTGTASDNESNDDRVDGENQSCHFKRRLIVWVAMVSVFLGLSGLGSGVAIAVVLGGNSGERDTNNTNCGIEAVYGLCNNDQESFSHIPDCLVDRYHQIQTYIPLFDSDFDLSKNSCLPANLAVWSIAATAPMNATLISILHRYVLGTLFFETRGPTRWYRRDKWLTAESECSWYGVSCNHDQSALEGISLHGNELLGPLPSQLGLLPALGEYTGELVLALHNWLTAIFHFAESVTLEVGDAKISGRLPSELGSIETLSTFLDWSDRFLCQQILTACTGT